MFTEHRNGIISTLWDGDYETYMKLCREEAPFVGVLDNSTGKEVLKVFTGEGWASCSPGQYVTKHWRVDGYRYGVIDTPYERMGNEIPQETSRNRSRSA